MDPIKRLLERVKESGDSLLLRAEKESLTRSAFLKRATAFADALKSRGFRKGDGVLLLHEEFIPCFVSVFGTWLADGVAMPLNPSTPTSGKETARELAGARFVSEGKETYEFPLSRPADDERDLILFTSGTTGAPKGVLLARKSFGLNAYRFAKALKLREDDRVLITTPPYYTSALHHFATVIEAGAELVGERNAFFGESLLHVCRRENATVVAGAPTHLTRAIETAGAQCPEALRLWITSGDRLPVRTLEKVGVLFPDLTVVAVYGLTEVSGRLCTREFRSSSGKRGSVGKPLEGMHVQVINAEGNPAAGGETGEIVISSDTLFLGYLGGTASEREFRTGDFGFVDEQGDLWLEGRHDDQIKVGAEKVILGAVQDALLGLGDFLEAAVIAADDDWMGKVVEAYVVVKPELGFEAAAVLRRLRERLPSSHLPRRITALDSLPRTGSGKFHKGSVPLSHCER